MKRFLYNAVIIFICIILHTTVFRAMSISGIIPNILIVVTACAGFMQGKRIGMFTGFVCGLALDVFGFSPFGYFALLYMIIGFLNGYFSNTFYPEDFKLPLILITLSDLSCSLFEYLTLFLLRSRFDFSYYFMNIILPELAYTLFTAVFMYLILLITQKLIFKTFVKEE